MKPNLHVLNKLDFFAVQLGLFVFLLLDLKKSNQT